MAQTGSRKKLRRSAKDKPYYERFRREYSGKLIRRRASREKRIAFFEANPTAGSPSQVRTRKHNLNKKTKNHENKNQN